MPSSSRILDEVKEFLDSIVVDLTNLHVHGATLRNTPGDQGALDGVETIPGDVIARAQTLSGKVEKAQDSDKPAGGSKSTAR